MATRAASTVLQAASDGLRHASKGVQAPPHAVGEGEEVNAVRRVQAVTAVATATVDRTVQPHPDAQPAVSQVQPLPLQPLQQGRQLRTGRSTRGALGRPAPQVGGGGGRQLLDRSQDLRRRGC